MTRISARVISAAPTNDVIEVKDCTTTLLFPYVTNKHGYETGLVITNASEEAGSCVIGYSSSDGFDAPEDLTPPDIAGGEQWINLVSLDCPRIPGLYDCKL